MYNPTLRTRIKYRLLKRYDVFLGKLRKNHATFLKKYELKMKLDMSVTAWQSLRQKAYQNNPYCAGCRRKMGLKQFTVDHIVPMSKGGKTTLANLQVMCSGCHNRKDNEKPKRSSGHFEVAFEKIDLYAKEK